MTLSCFCSCCSLYRLTGSGLLSLCSTPLYFPIWKIKIRSIARLCQLSHERHRLRIIVVKIHDSVTYSDWDRYISSWSAPGSSNPWLKVLCHTSFTLKIVALFLYKRCIERLGCFRSSGWICFCNPCFTHSGEDSRSAPASAIIDWKRQTKEQSKVAAWTPSSGRGDKTVKSHVNFWKVRVFKSWNMTALANVEFRIFWRVVFHVDSDRVSPYSWKITNWLRCIFGRFAVCLVKTISTGDPLKKPSRQQWTLSASVLAVFYGPTGCVRAGVQHR